MLAKFNVLNLDYPPVDGRVIFAYFRVESASRLLNCHRADTNHGSKKPTI